MKIIGKRLTVLRLSLNKHALAHSVMLLGETKILLKNISTIDILERKIFNHMIGLNHYRGLVGAQEGVRQPL